MPVMINSKNTPFNTFTPVKLYSSECVAMRKMTFFAMGARRSIADITITYVVD